MAVEAKRKCGCRVIGGLYLVGEGLGKACDRLPLPIIPCPTCGEELRFNRSIGRINPLRLWGLHEEQGRCYLAGEEPQRHHIVIVLCPYPGGFTQTYRWSGAGW